MTSLVFSLVVTNKVRYVGIQRATRWGGERERVEREGVEKY